MQVTPIQVTFWEWNPQQYVESSQRAISLAYCNFYPQLWSLCESRQLNPMPSDMEQGKMMTWTCIQESHKSLSSSFPQSSAS